VQFDDQDVVHEIRAGAVILATGFESFNPARIEGLGYGQIDDVYTLPEFERISNSNGPYQGVLKMKNGSKPESVAVIHCAGSLSEKGLPYCSGLCCQLATKVGEVVRKQIPEAKVFNLHDRLVFKGPDQEKFFHHQVHEGTVFLRTPDIQSVKVSREGGKIRVTAPGVETLTVDMVVLATGLAAPANNRALADMLGLDLTPSGFFKSDHYYLRSMGTSLDGIYTVGGCLGACDAREAVVQAQAAAGEAVSRLVPGRKIELEMATCEVDETVCAGCKLCISICPYHATGYNPDKAVSEINQAVCRGCGTCAANCPAGAIRATHFTRDQINAEIEGILND
jgi:heterodisulfide reductase subunit A